jgi:hypothetical protein
LDQLVDPLPAEIGRISADLGTSIDYLTYPLDIDKRARTEKDESAAHLPEIPMARFNLPALEKMAQSKAGGCSIASLADRLNAAARCGGQFVQVFH